METIGFSTGSLARSDFAAALRMLKPHATGAVELSALRARELRPLLAAIPHLDRSAFHDVTIHGPSAFSAGEEHEVAGLLAPWAAQGWTVVIHPDSIRDFRLWAGFGACLSIKNMDARKPCGRTAGELQAIFARSPTRRSAWTRPTRGSWIPPCARRGACWMRSASGFRTCMGASLTRRAGTCA